MLTKNSSEYLADSLSALKSFDEIIVLDNGSTDDTIGIAQSFENVKLHKHEFIGFGPLKQLAVSLASNDWILSIDSDEIVGEKLREEILQSAPDKENVYAIRRDNYYGGRVVRCCGWDNDYVLRFFHRGRVNFDDKQVHESLAIGDAKVQKLKNSMQHHSFNSAEELINKMQHYSTLYARENTGRKESSVWKALSRSCFAFIKNYIFQKGFLYGYEGLLISISNANGVFYKYIKLLEENRK